MEFVDKDEVLSLLREQGIQSDSGSDDCVYLRMTGGDEIVHLHLACGESESVPLEGASVVDIAKDRLAGTINHILHKLRLNQVVLAPVGKWRNVFDAVAFRLAENEDWQAIDAAATVELNTRDPLLCEPGDFHTLQALIDALLTDAESPVQGLIVTSTSAPVVIEIIPDGALRISLGNPVLADEVAETIAG